MLFSVSLLFSLCWLHCSLTLHLGRAGLGGSVYREGSLTEAGGAWCSQCIALYTSRVSISEMVHHVITGVTESLLTCISLLQHNYYLTCQFSLEHGVFCPLKIRSWMHIYRIVSHKICPSGDDEALTGCTHATDTGVYHGRGQVSILVPAITFS